MTWRGLLLPAAGVYGLASSLRRQLYTAGWLERRKAPVPVICIGNLSLGGTGKTPMVAYTVRALQELGRKPGVASRGYKRKTPPRELVCVSQGAGILANPDQAGDEPVLLAHMLPQTPVAVCADRFQASEFLANECQCDCVVLDDGFQHLRLFRDADIVLIDATAELSRMRLFPAGTLRETTAQLIRATAVVHTRIASDMDIPVRAHNRLAATDSDAQQSRTPSCCHQPSGMDIPVRVHNGLTATGSDPEPFRNRSCFHQQNREVVSRISPSVPQFEARFVSCSLEPFPDQNRPSSAGPGSSAQHREPLALDFLQGKRVAAFAGIAHPEAFFDDLRRAGALVEEWPLPDHAAPDPQQLARILSSEADLAITTEKDAVKLSPEPLPPGARLYVLRQQVELTPAGEYRALLKRVLER